MNLNANVRSDAMRVRSLSPLPWYWLMRETLEVPTISLNTLTNHSMVEIIVMDATAFGDM